MALVLTGCSSDSDSGSDAGSDAKKANAEAKDSPRLTVRGAYVPQPVNGKMAGGFLTVRNSGGTADKLTSVSSDIAGDVTMHKTVKQQMQSVASFTVPAEGSLKLARGGNHLMLMDLKRKPAEGDTVTFVLHFTKSGPITVKAPVKAMNYAPGQ
nr:copper chaperone PCu(A)C [Streptomyces boncukensis]